MVQEIIVQFEEFKNMTLEFYNDNYDTKQPSLKIPIGAVQIKIKIISDVIKETCYISNITSFDVKDNNTNNIYRTTYLQPNKKVRIISNELETLILIY